MEDWQQAVAVAIGAVPSSITEKQRAFQMLHDSGIGYRLPGHISETLRDMVKAGVVKVDDEAKPDQA